MLGARKKVSKVSWCLLFAYTSIQDIHQAGVSEQVPFGGGRLGLSLASGVYSSQDG